MVYIMQTNKNKKEGVKERNVDVEENRTNSRQGNKCKAAESRGRE